MPLCIYAIRAIKEKVTRNVKEGGGVEGVGVKKRRGEMI